jgi:hypothetical protein
MEAMRFLRMGAIVGRKPWAGASPEFFVGRPNLLPLFPHITRWLKQVPVSSGLARLPQNPIDEMVNMRKTQILLSLVLAAGLVGCGADPMDTRDAAKALDTKPIDLTVTTSKNTSTATSTGTTSAKFDARPASDVPLGTGDAGPRPPHDTDGGAKLPAADGGPSPPRDTDGGAKPPAGDDGGPRPPRDTDGGPKPPAEGDGGHRPGHDDDGGPKPPAEDDGGHRPGHETDGGSKPPAEKG